MTGRRFLPLLAAFLTAVMAIAATAQDRAAVDQQFRRWLEADLWPDASAAGVARATFDRVFNGLSLQWDLPDLVPPGAPPKRERKQSQAEFRAPARYFAPGVIAPNVSAGRAKLAAHRALLARLERETGVPGHILLAIWGRESGFGRASIPHDAFRVLATKAFMSTRPDLFRRELIAALLMVERGEAAPAQMKSSWAGAMGQPQFLPSSYLAHAADGDGDGRADIWNSEADTLASIAGYLAARHWVRGRDWGFEVTVPAGVPCYLEGPDRGRPIAQWSAMGIRRVSGKPFPANEVSQEGYLLMPAGRHGPAFIVTPNFYVLKEYNESDLYALFVGHVGDRIAYGVAPFQADWQPLDPVLRSDIAQFQRSLERLGYDVGGADGLPGYKTRRSTGEWQERKGRDPTCFPTRGLMRQG